MNSLSAIDDPKIRIKFNLLKINKAYKKSTGLHIFEPAYMYCILMKCRYIYCHSSSANTSIVFKSFMILHD